MSAVRRPLARRQEVGEVGAEAHPVGVSPDEVGDGQVEPSPNGKNTVSVSLSRGRFPSPRRISLREVAMKALAVVGREAQKDRVGERGLPLRVQQVRVPNRAQYLVFGPVEDLPNLVGP